MRNLYLAALLAVGGAPLLVVCGLGAPAPDKVSPEEETPQEVQAYFEIGINGQPAGSLNFLLRPDVAPKTVDNFIKLLPRYPGTQFHRIIPDFMIQGGDVEKNETAGANTERVPSFNDESFELKHTGPGILSMANAGPNTNSSQFFVTTVATPWLDGRHVVFGKTTDESMEVLKRIEALGSSSGRPSGKIIVTASGLGHKPNIAV